MRYYPVSLDINNAVCVVVGGGGVAQRKVDGLLRAGACVTVISPEVTKRINGLALKGKITLVKRGYKKGDLKGARLVISAAGAGSVNRAVFAEAKRRNALCNVVDEPDLCGFIVPSVVDRGSLTIAVSTSGKSPLFAKALRRSLESKLGKEYAVFTELLGAVRSKLLKEGCDYDKKEQVIKKLIDSPALSQIRLGKVKTVDRILESVLGKGCTLKNLGIKFNKGKA